ETYAEALSVIKDLKLQPTMICHSGGGFHAYWVLVSPVSVQEYGIEFLESINTGIITTCKGDKGTQDLGRILRVPGSLNMKVQADDGSYRQASIVDVNGRYYQLDEMDVFLPQTETQNYEDLDRLGFTVKPESVCNQVSPKESEAVAAVIQPSIPININQLNISQRVKKMITDGHDSKSIYSTRSESDLAATLGMISNGIHPVVIHEIFKTYKIGEKYREHPDPAQYLNYTIARAQQFVGLTDQQKEDPLFISGSVKVINNDLMLDTLNFQEYICRRENIVFHADEECFYRFNEKYFEKIHQQKVNKICQKSLTVYRRLFKNAKFKEFLHFATGDNQICGDNNIDFAKMVTHQKRYLTFENCNFDLYSGDTIPHSANIFTTAKLDYNFQDFIDCPRWKEFINEIFYGDVDMAQFVQECVGYVFYTAIPIPALFLFVGGGANGKSVFLDVLGALVGESNVASIALHKLNDERYIPLLENKFINICAETPNRKLLDLDVLKAVTGGDSISGRKLYQEAKNYRFFTKHFLAMNKFPEIADDSLGLKRRLYIIEFPRTFVKDEADVSLSG
ncbi:hypothetical protein KAI46_14750, partial [bacterium]|nr:hypothetical protein [bacterium]